MQNNVFKHYMLDLTRPFALCGRIDFNSLLNINDNTVKAWFCIITNQSRQHPARIQCMVHSKSHTQFDSCRQENPSDKPRARYKFPNVPQLSNNGRTFRLLLKMRPSYLNLVSRLTLTCKMRSRCIEQRQCVQRQIER